MIRVLITDSALSAALSSFFSSVSKLVGLILSGSNLIWKEALAGQISVTPAIWLSLTAFVIDRDLKKAWSDIASSISAKMCSSPPNEYRVFMAEPSLSRQSKRVLFKPALEPARVVRCRPTLGDLRQGQAKRLRRLASTGPQLTQRPPHTRGRPAARLIT